MSCKTYNSCVTMTSQFYLCANPLRVDTYRGCSHKCEYCFATRPIPLIADQDFFSEIIPANLNSLFSAFRNVNGGSQKNSVIELIRQGQPLHVGGMSDPFQPSELKFGVTGQLLDLLVKTKYPAIFSTKGLAVINYIEQLKAARSCAQISLIANKALEKIEPNAPSAVERIHIIEQLTNNNIPVVIRCQPAIPELINEFLEVLEACKNLKIVGVTVEGLKRSHNFAAKMKGLIEYLGYDPFIDRKRTAHSNTVEYPTDVKMKYLNKIKSKCRDLGFGFFVADNDFRDFGDHWNCCGFSSIKGYDKAHSFQLSPLLFRDEFSFESIRTCKIGDCSVSNSLQASGLASAWFKNNMPMKVFLQNFFNKNTGNCVSSVFPRAIPVALTKDKNVIYKVKRIKDEDL